MSQVVNHTKFSQNWNRAKLDCNFFTTFRQRNDKKYAVGTVHEIWLGERQIGQGIVVQHTTAMADTLSDVECWLDTGYNAQDTKRMLVRMYKKNSASELDLSKVVFQVVKRY